MKFSWPFGKNFQPTQTLTLAMQPPPMTPFDIKCKGFLQNYTPDFDRCFIAGGVFPRLYHDLPIRDIDVFVEPDHFKDFVKEYRSLHSILTVVDKEKYAKFFYNGVHVDLIAFHKPSSIACLNYFDFTICKGYFTKDRFRLQGDHSFDDIIQKKLIFTGQSNYTSGDNNILARIQKYINLGFTIDNEELTKIYHHLANGEYRKETGWEENYCKDR